MRKGDSKMTERVGRLTEVPMEQLCSTRPHELKRIFVDASAHCKQCDCRLIGVKECSHFRVRAEGEARLIVDRQPISSLKPPPEKLHIRSTSERQRDAVYTFVWRIFCRQCDAPVGQVRCAEDYGDDRVELFLKEVSVKAIDPCAFLRRLQSTAQSEAEIGPVKVDLERRLVKSVLVFMGVSGLDALAEVVGWKKKVPTGFADGDPERAADLERPQAGLLRDFLLHLRRFYAARNEFDDESADARFFRKLRGCVRMSPKCFHDASTLMDRFGEMYDGLEDTTLQMHVLMEAVKCLAEMRPAKIDPDDYHSALTLMLDRCQESNVPMHPLFVKIYLRAIQAFQDARSSYLRAIEKGENIEINDAWELIDVDAERARILECLPREQWDLSVYVSRMDMFRHDPWALKEELSSLVVCFKGKLPPLILKAIAKDAPLLVLDHIQRNEVELKYVAHEPQRSSHYDTVFPCTLAYLEASHDDELAQLLHAIIWHAGKDCPDALPASLLDDVFAQHPLPADTQTILRLRLRRSLYPDCRPKDLTLEALIRMDVTQSRYVERQLSDTFDTIVEARMLDDVAGTLAFLNGEHVHDFYQQILATRLFRASAAGHINLHTVARSDLTTKVVYLFHAIREQFPNGRNFRVNTGKMNADDKRALYECLTILFDHAPQFNCRNEGMLYVDVPRYFAFENRLGHAIQTLLQSRLEKA